MPSSQDIEQLQDRLSVNRTTLATLLTQRDAFSSAHVPPPVVSGIREARANIQQIKATLRSWGVPFDDLPDDTAFVPPPSAPPLGTHVAPSPPRQLNVFLCHASEDKPAVRQFYQRLRAAGVTPWLDAEDLLPGQRWQTAIPNAVRASDLVLVCLSRRSVTKTGYVQKEVAFALDVAEQQPANAIYLIPLRLEACEVPERLHHLQWVDLFGGAGFDRLLRALDARATEVGAIPPVLPPATAEENRARRQRWLSRFILPVVVVVVGLLALLAWRGVKDAPVYPVAPTAIGLVAPTTAPTVGATAVPTIAPTVTPTVAPTVAPTAVPTVAPTVAPTLAPTAIPLPAALVPEMVAVPAGEFLMGSTDQQIADAISQGASADWIKNEKPQHKLTLPAYEIGKTEVTNAQFRPFVEGDGYINRAYWDDAGWQWRTDAKRKQPACWGWDDAKWNGDNQPVVCVTLYEAAAYTRWLSAQTGQNFTLPTEAQWEKAARGPNGRIYPWGDTWDAKLANTNESGFGKTTPVGQYPGGASPYDALDMAGNVWEWTQSTLEPYPLVQPTGETLYIIRADRAYVLRGGAWAFPLVGARCAERHDNPPHFDNFFYGFRLARLFSLP